jgi:hypothetical protein
VGSSAAPDLDQRLLKMFRRLSELDTLTHGGRPSECGARTERLINSAMHAVRTSLGAEYESVRPTVESYSGADVADDWPDRIQTLAQAFREDQTNPERQKVA